MLRGLWDRDSGMIHPVDLDKAVDAVVVWQTVLLKHYIQCPHDSTLAGNVKFEERAKEHLKEAIKHLIRVVKND